MAGLTIVGMACSVAGMDLSKFERAIYHGELLTPRAYPKSDVLISLAQSLLEELSLDTQPLPRLGLVVCDAELPSDQVATVAAGLGTLAAEAPVARFGPEALVDALTVASRWLGGKLVDLVLVISRGTVGCAGVLLVDADRNGKVPGYATIVGYGEGVTVHRDDAANGVFQTVGLSIEDVGYLDTAGWPPTRELLTTFSTGGSDLTCAIGGIATSETSGLALVALIKAALCIHRRMLVPTPHDAVVDRDAAWAHTPFYTIQVSQPWLVAGSGPRHVAEVIVRDSESLGCALLKSPAVRRPLPAFRPELARRRLYLVPVIGQSQQDLLAGLDRLRRDLETAADGVAAADAVAALAAKGCRGANASPCAALALVLVGRDREELLKELAYAVDRVAGAFDNRHTWRTPKGSVFTSMPLGEHGVTYVYPGVFNSYLGLVGDLFQYVPGLSRHMSALTPDWGALLAAESLYPRLRRRQTREDQAQAMARLLADPVAMIRSGSAVAIAYTHVMEVLFGVQGRKAMGYSMGESTMLFATGVWRDAEEGSRALCASPVFSTMISGPRTSVREAWELGPHEAVTWGTYLVKARVDRVDAAVAAEPRVYVSLVNLDNEVVIAGDEAGCRRVIEALDCHALPVPATVAIHNPAMHGAYDALYELYSRPVAAQPNMDFYSASSYGKLELNRAILADAMATTCCQPVDFPRLVSQVYEEGARVFLELGPLGTCTRRIDRILKGKPHVAVAVNPSPGDDLDGVLQALAVLVAHRVPVDLSPLYEAPAPEPLRIAVRHEDSVPTSPDPVDQDTGDEVGGSSDASIQVWQDAIPAPAWQPERVALGAAQQADAAVQGAAHVQGRTTTSGRLVVLHEGFLLPERQSAARVHLDLLRQRYAAQARAGKLISLQAEVGRAMLGCRTGDQGSGSLRTHEALTEPVRPVFHERALRAFAEGDAAACFGEAFDVYRGRRLPRIPNGDLLMMNRVTAVVGKPGDVTPPASLSSEFEVHSDAWFYLGGAYAGLPPNFVLMEMALQPCGFLSAYLRSSLLDPDADLYFRNLDGRGRVLADLNLRGSIVQSDVQLLSSTRGQGTILQTYSYSLSCRGERFYEGWASFGYFPKRSLTRQAGMARDVATSGMPNGDSAGVAHTPLTISVPLTTYRLPRRLQLVNAVTVHRPGELNGGATLEAGGEVSPSDWWFRSHFFQDPVMPGSLGVEAALQTVAAYGRWRYPQLRHGLVRSVVGTELVWKYRGQITPGDGAWRVIVQVDRVLLDGNCATLSGSASLWNDGVRIYEADGMAVCLCRA